MLILHIKLGQVRLVALPDFWDLEHILSNKPDVKNGIHPNVVMGNQIQPVKGLGNGVGVAGGPC
jgi:hypothetical protein